MHVSLNITTNTGILTLQSAVHSAMTSLNATTATLPLYHHGCDFVDLAGHFTRNCTLACQQPAAVWDSMTTLHNCLSYGAVSTLLTNGGLSEKDEEFVLGMGYLKDANVANVTEPIDACMHSFCREITTSGDCYAHVVHVSDQHNPACLVAGGQEETRRLCSNELDDVVMASQLSLPRSSGPSTLTK